MAIRNLVPWRKDVPVRRATSDSPLAALRQEMDQLFDRFFDGFPADPFDWMGGTSAFRPRIDVSENDTEMTISAELPGVEEKDIEVSVSDGNLTISGERREENEDRNRDYYRREQFYGSFQRTIPLPRGVDAENVSASFKRGVLTVLLRKTEAAQRKKISVQAA